MPRIGRKKLNLDIPEELHEMIKKVADFHYMTMTRYLIKILKEQMIRERDLKNIE
jgi:hypothetical protein